MASTLATMVIGLAILLASGASTAMTPLFLRATGVPNSTLTAAAPTATTLTNFDSSRDSSPGLLIAKGGSGASESDSTKYQRWLSPTGGLTLSGSVELRLWSAMKDFSTGKAGSVTAYLRDCNSSGGSCTAIASKTLTVANWNTSAAWVLRTISFGTVTYTIGATRTLELKIIVASGAGDDMWFAYDTTTYATVLGPPPAAAPNHYELSVSASSLACVASTVTVTACTNTSSPCTSAATTLSGQTATLATGAGTLGATSVSFNASGVATTTLSHAAAVNGAVVTVTLSGESTAATAARKCCQGGSCSTANSCATTFSRAGFIVAASTGGAAATVPTQTAGTSSGNHVLRAVRSSTSTQACEAALSGVNSVDWAYTCNDPTTCSAGNRVVLTGNGATTIAANPNTGVTSTTAVPMTFDANGNAPFSFTYSDVGRITLHASKAAGGSLLTALSGTSNAFVVKPAGLVLSNVKCSSYSAGACATAAIASPGNNPAAASSSGTAFIPAGRAFSATVTAVDSGGSAVPNFGKETSPEGVTLAPTLVLPAAGTAGTLSNAGGFGSFSGGAATGTAFAYSEVGIITLTPSLASGNYLGSGGAVTGTASGHVGRFYPDHFTTSVTPGCSASFTYSGQPFAATLSAHNAAGAVVANYGGTTFAKAVTLSDGASLGTGSYTAGSSVAAAAFTSGVAAAAPAYTFTNKLTAPGTLALRATDTDGASSAGHAEGNALLRSGRLRVANGFGREGAALPLAVQAEYWTGAAWLLNGSDSCTVVPAAAVALGHYRNHLGTSTAAWSTSASAVGIAAGSGLLTLSAPAPAATGSVALALNLGSTTADQSCTSGLPASTGAALPWLRALNGACAASHDRDPAARASFGIFSPETRKTVHAHEIF
ncbi:MAG: DUF6701 domain-containing protein [Rubrivivax sp.]|nr:DUF6701 domain-containing protein [Rubrivivax sp.]